MLLRGLRAAGDGDDQRPRAPGAHQPAARRRPRDLARLHAPRLQERRRRPGNARPGDAPRRRLRQHRSAAPPNSKTQICLVVDRARRAAGGATVAGGWYLPADTTDDVRAGALRLLRFGHHRADARDERGRRSAARTARGRRPRGCRSWWPLAALTRARRGAAPLARSGLQSFWFDEAFTPLHVLHPSLFTTLRMGAENREQPAALVPARVVRLPPARQRRVRAAAALRARRDRARARRVGDRPRARRPRRGDRHAPRSSRSARCSSGTRRRRASTGCSCSPRGLAMLCVRARAARADAGGASRWFAAGRRAVPAHPLLRRLHPRRHGALAAGRPAHAPALAARARGDRASSALALLPLISAQGGRGTQWIGEWALKERIEDIADYYLDRLLRRARSATRSRRSSACRCSPSLRARGLADVEAARPAAAGGATAARRGPARARRRQAVWVTLAVTAAGGADPARAGARRRRLPRAAQPGRRDGARSARSSPCSRPGRAPRDAIGPTLLVVALLALLAVTLTVESRLEVPARRLEGRRQRRSRRATERAMVVNELGSAPLRYYTPGLGQLPAHGLRARARNRRWRAKNRCAPRAGTPPAPGFRLVKKHRLHGPGGPPLRGGHARSSSPGARCATRTSRWCTRTCSLPAAFGRRARLAFQHARVDRGGPQRGSAGAGGRARAPALAPARVRLVARRAADERDDGRRGPAPAGVPRRPRAPPRPSAAPPGSARSSAPTAPGRTSTRAPATSRRRSRPTGRCGSPATTPARSTCGSPPSSSASRAGSRAARVFTHLWLALFGLWSWERGARAAGGDRAAAGVVPPQRLRLRLLGAPDDRGAVGRQSPPPVPAAAVRPRGARTAARRRARGADAGRRARAATAGCSRPRPRAAALRTARRSAPLRRLALRPRGELDRAPPGGRRLVGRDPAALGVLADRARPRAATRSTIR